MASSEELRDGLLANMFTCYEMPDSGHSERTETTRRIGGFVMLKHLVSGDWQEVPDDIATEVVARIVANAQRQGMQADDIVHRATSYQQQ